MNVFNRIVIVLLILVAMILIPLALVLPEQAEVALRYAADFVAANLAWLASLTPSAQIGVRLILAAVGLIVFLLGLLFLALEVLRFRRRTVRLRDGSGELLMDGVSGHLAYHIDLLPDVLRVRPKVESKGKSVRTSLYVETAPGINVPAKSAEIKETARRVIEDQLGLELGGEIKVVIRPTPYPRGDRLRAGDQETRRMPPAEATAAPDAGFEDFVSTTESSEPLRESDFVVPSEDEAHAEGNGALEAKGPEQQ